MKSLFSILISLILTFNFCCIAQNNTIEIKGTVIESVKKTSLPFTHIIINDSVEHFTADIDGNFIIKIDPTKVHTITFKQPLYRSFHLTKHIDSLLKINPFFEVILHPQELHTTIDSTKNSVKKLIAGVVKNTNKNNPDVNNSYSCTGYNKIILTTKEKAATQNIFDYIYKYLFRIKQRTDLGDHHIFLLETISEKQFIDQYHQKELVTSYKVSGIEDPSLLLAGTNSENFSIYDNFIKITGSQYINPINKNTFRRYNFEISDTIPVQESNDTLLVVKFSQKETKNFQGLKGFLYISKKDTAVQYFSASPMLYSSFQKNIYQSYGKLSNGKWFPVQTNTFMSFGKLGSTNSELYLSSKKINTNIIINKSLGKQYFNEYIFEYNSGYNIDNQEYWNANRMDFLSQKDLNTYRLYDSIGKKKYLDKFIDAGHKLYYGQLPLNKVNVDLNRIFSFNDYENFRTGFGFHTNEKFNKTFQTGLYFGYGTKDEKFKYGGDLSIILNKNIDWKLNLIHHYDLSVSGESDWAFNEYLFSSERLRKYRVLIKDKERKSEVNMQIHPFKYMNFQYGISQTQKTPTYLYQFDNNAIHTFHFLETSLGIRYAFREQFVKTEMTKISKGSNFPIIYFNFTKSFDIGSNIGQFEYNKYSLRLDKIFNTLNFGHSTLQVKMGYIDNAKVPYMNIFNIGGSNNNDVTFVAHNSFMTMGYNEFSANKYLNIFYSHNFGRFYARDRFFNPEIELIGNMGWGSLANSEIHKNINIKSMEKGFYEAGLNMNNIINLNIVGLNLGLGVGFFYRIGDYAFSQNSRNLMSKITTNFYF